MKIAVTSYSYSSLKIDDFECIRLAKKMGFDAIEFAEIHPDGSDKKEHAKKLKALSDELNLPIINYAIGADFINKGLDSEVERLKYEIEVASILGVKVMRHDATYGPDGEQKSLTGFEKYLPTLAEGCRRVTEYAKQFGIKTSVENHGLYCQQSDRVEALMKAVDNDNFGWLVDIGNFLCADENPLDAVKVGAKYAVYAHIKDFYFSPKEQDMPDGYFETRGGNYLCGCVHGDGIVPIGECIDILKKAGYNGAVTLEYEGKENPETGVPKSLEFLRKTI
ncbi:MAG: sugar phosphate isomerase/epimerase [Clostridia bacterium]|nr:sugar phosphate isomerase/epimerase [Clostridia bacterium]